MLQKDLRHLMLNRNFQSCREIESNSRIEFESEMYMRNILKCNGELVTINGHKIHIYRHGNVNVPKIILMSGSGTVAPVYDFKVLYEKLFHNFGVIVIEKYGYGYSDICESPCDIDTLVSIQRQALEIVGETGPYILASHSMSGLEAIRWKQKYPNEVAAIIGIDMANPLTYNNWTDDEIKKRTRLMRVATRLKFANILCQLNNRSLTKDEINQHKLLRKRNAFNICYINEAGEVLNNSRVVSEDENIKCPTLLFSSNGSQTSEDWLENQQEFASLMNAKLICFDCGHYIHHFKSDEMCKEIIEFINSLER